MRVRHRTHILITRRPLWNLSIHTHIRNRQNNNIARIVEHKPFLLQPTRTRRHIVPPTNHLHHTLLRSQTTPRVARRPFIQFTFPTCQFRHFRSSRERKRITFLTILQDTLSPSYPSMRRITTRVRRSPARIRIANLRHHHLTPTRPTRTRYRRRHPPLLPRVLSPNTFINRYRRPKCNRMRTATLTPQRFKRFSIFAKIIRCRLIPSNRTTSTRRNLMQTSRK